MNLTNRRAVIVSFLNLPLVAAVKFITINSLKNEGRADGGIYCWQCETCKRRVSSSSDMHTPLPDADNGASISGDVE
jgi:hypothetical protein